MRSKHPLYSTYRSMIARCTDRLNPAWWNYGGRGIRVCDRWLYGADGKNGLACFIEDMGDRPEGMTLDRTNNNGNYEPDNCQWATSSQQGRNRRGHGGLLACNTPEAERVRRVLYQEDQDDFEMAKRMWEGHSSLEVTAIYTDVSGKEEDDMARRMWE